MFYQYCVGVDISAQMLNVVALKSGVNGIQLAAHTSCVFDESVPPGNRADLVTEVVSDVVRRHRLGVPDLFIAIPREIVVARKIRFPLAVKENLYRTLRYEMPKFVPMAVEEIYYDYIIVEEDKSANEMELMLFVVKKRDLEPYLDLHRGLGQPMSGIEIASTAAAHFLQRNQEAFDRANVGLIHMTSSGGELSCYRNGVLAFSQVIRPGQGKDTTGAVAAAVTAANNDGMATPPEKWLYFSRIPQEHSDRQLIQAAGVTMEQLDAASAGLPSTDMIPAYGLALKGLRHPNGGPNFIPSNQRKKPSRLSYYAMLSLALLVLVLSVTWGAGQLLKHRLVVASLDKQVNSLRADIDAVETLVADIDAAQQRIQRISGLRHKSISSLAMLKELSLLVPQSAHVQEMHFKQDGIRITGLADSASELLEVLEASALFKDVVFLAAITKTKEGKERYRIGMGFE